MNKDNNSPIPRKWQDIQRILEEKAGLHQSFDVLFREMTFGGKKTGLLNLNGLADEEVLTLILKRMSYISREQIVPDTLSHFMEQFIPHIQVNVVHSMDEAIQQAFSGASALFIEGESSAIIIDAKNFPNRSIEEPSTEKVVRGSKDGFTETLLTNVTLVRRRIRDPRLKFEAVRVGSRTRMDVCLGYIQDIVDLSLVESVRKKLENIVIGGIPLADKQLEEALIEGGWNPFPLVRYSERPDVIAAHLLEGHLILFVDTSPSVMILPTTFFHLAQHAEEYRQTPLIGTYLRWVRFIGIFASLFLLPVWFLLALHPDLKPPALAFIGPDKPGTLPILLQFILAEIGVDLMRMAAVHTPSPIATAMGLVAAVLIGDIAVKTGLFVNEVILYMSVAAVGMFATPNYELGLANRIVRLLLLLAVALFKVPGLVVGSTIFIIFLATRRSYNTPYLWPFIPFNFKALVTIMFRLPFLSEKNRPSITKPLDDMEGPTSR